MQHTNNESARFVTQATVWQFNSLGATPALQANSAW